MILIVAVSLSTGLIFGNWLTLSSTVHQFSDAGSVGVGTIFATLTNGSLFFQDWVMFLEQTYDGQTAFISDFRNSDTKL